MAVLDPKVLKIERGGLAARLILPPHPQTADAPPMPTLDELTIWLRGQGIGANLDFKFLESGLQSLYSGQAVNIVFAEGQEPIPGLDGYIEYLVEFGHSLTPILTEKGQVDLKASLIHNVKPGDPLALVHFPTAGKPGMDIFGNILAANPGKEMEPRLGTNVERSANDVALIIAKTSGHVHLSDGLLDVQEFYMVSSDVDYGTGNIAFGKAVLIEGDVRAGFSVESGGDLEVTGLVEDCQIKSQGKILVQGGFTGQGKGLMLARGDITLGYVRNQHVKGEKTIVVLKEVVNGNMQARQSITVNGLLAGGKIQARYVIECQTAGTESGTPTQIEAGYDFTVMEELLDIRAEMDKLGKYSKKLNDSLRQIHDIEKLNRGLEPWTIELMFEMENARTKVEAKSKSLRDRFAALENEATDPEMASITVHRKVYPGVMIKMGKEMYLVDEPLTGPKTFYSSQGLILIK